MTMLRSRYRQSPTSSSTGRIGKCGRRVGRSQCDPNTFMNHRITRRGEIGDGAASDGNGIRDGPTGRAANRANRRHRADHGVNGGRRVGGTPSGRRAAVAVIGECVTADRGACTVCDSQHGAAAAGKRLLRLQEARDGHRALPSRRFESAAERAQGLAVTVGAPSALPALAPAASAESVPAALALALSSALTPPALALASAALPPSITSRR